MTESRLPCEAALEAAGFTAFSPADCPPQIRIYHRPQTWRERLPIVRGYRRMVAVVDVPITNAQRGADLFNEIAHLNISLLAEQAERAISAPQAPWWTVPAQILALLVGVLAAVTVGVSIEMSNQDWLVVIFPNDRLDADGQQALGEVVASGEAYTAVSVLTQRDRAVLLVAPQNMGRFRANARQAAAALGDIQACLAEQMELRRLGPTA